jgi:hypothetical protein
VADSRIASNDAARRRSSGPVDAALLTLITGFAFSLAANLIWTWPGGPVRILGGALASLALPGAIHLWHRIPVTGRPTRCIRALVMSSIALMAAYTTFSHASSLLIAKHEDPILAYLYPLMTELLVVMGVLARRGRGAEQRVPLAPAPESVALMVALSRMAIPQAKPARPKPRTSVPIRPHLVPEKGSTPWAKRKDELIAAGTPRSTAHAKARREWEAAHASAAS